jgi:hypothetical protein
MILGGPAVARVIVVVKSVDTAIESALATIAAAETITRAKVGQ